MSVKLLEMFVTLLSLKYIRYFVNTPVPSVNYCDGLDRCILYRILFVFMLALLRFCVATEFSVNKDLYKTLSFRLSALVHWRI